MDTVPRFQGYRGEVIREMEDPELFSLKSSKDEIGCSAISALGYCCTREHGHEGPHIAHGLNMIVAIWD
jgi:hypothetical protein